MAHFLKRLELSGFKSFAQKTVFDFPDGITAVVGPNGSGKSNIIDAVRWLLGEREAKNLRSAKAEDLIFAGTPERARLGQAQASLYFENHKNFFPVDFNEIVISRYVSRDGNNTYFINKSEVRLKDVIDFFARSRLGTKGLVVVTQGNSDVFVQSPPVARRIMLEEMLGLREYQLKKSEAGRRLKNTNINLEKARALLEEILPHLRSLKRQTHRFEKRDILEKELRDLENVFFGSQLEEIENKISQIEGKMSLHEEERKILEKEKKEAEKRLKEIEASEPEERQELNKIKNQIQVLLEKRSHLQKGIGRLEAQIELSGKKIVGQSDLEKEKVVELLLEIKNKLKLVLEEDSEGLKVVAREILDKIDSLLSGDKKGAQNDFIKDLKVQFGQIEKDLTDLEKEIAGLREKEKNLGENQEHFYKSFKEALAGLEAVKDRIGEWENQNRERILDKEKLLLRKDELERQIIQAGRRKEEFGHLESAGADRKERLSGEDWGLMERKIFKLRGDLASIGEIDETLLKEARETEERYQFLNRELTDLGKAQEDLKKLINDLNEKIGREFKASLAKINEEFNKFFRLMFGGGKAKLKLIANSKSQIVDKRLEKAEEGIVEIESKETEEKETEEGIEIELRLPQKKINSLDLLSGGEKSLVGIAALFALISVSPPPFLVLDEIDAALDSRNSRRFAEMLKEFSKKTQFVIVTHNQAVMESADVLYGITMNEDGTSKVLSLKLE